MLISCCENHSTHTIIRREDMRDLKTDHFEDLQLFDNRVHLFWSVLCIIFLFTLPFFVKSYYLSNINLMAVHVIIALGLNLLVGNTGQISLGHAGFVAIGAYTTVLLMQMGVPFALSIIASGAMAALFGILLGLPSLRLEGPYLSIATLAFGIAVTIFIGRMDFLGGRMGIKVPKLSLDWTGLKYDTALYYIFITFTIVAVIATRNILKSRVGRAFQAIRDSDIAAEAIGINLTKYKLYSFGLSAMFAGMAGSLMALYLGFVSPTQFTFILSITLLATIVLGGLGSVTGSIMGAIAMTFLSLRLENVVDIPIIGTAIEAFSETFMNPSGIANISWVLTGLILILVILFEPLGLYGIWIRTKIYWKRWPF